MTRTRAPSSSRPRSGHTVGRGLVRGPDHASICTGALSVLSFRQQQDLFFQSLDLVSLFRKHAFETLRNRYDLRRPTSDGATTATACRRDAGPPSKNGESPVPSRGPEEGLDLSLETYGDDCKKGFHLKDEDRLGRPCLPRVISLCAATNRQRYSVDIFEPQSTKPWHTLAVTSGL